MQGLRKEVRELEEALRHGSPNEILEEAADVANFAMMVADIHRQPTEGKERKEEIDKPC